LKTLTFAMTHFTVAFTVAWLLTGSILLGGLLALVEPAINTVAYALHESIWERIRSRSGTVGAGLATNGSFNVHAANQ